MARPKNKAAAREWRADTAAKRYADESFEQEREKLRYAGCKHYNMPNPTVFEAAGYSDAGGKIRLALGLLEEAYDSVSHVQIGVSNEH